MGDSPSPYYTTAGEGDTPSLDPTPSAPTTPQLRAFGAASTFGVLVSAPRWLKPSPLTVKILATSMIQRIRMLKCAFFFNAQRC